MPMTRLSAVIFDLDGVVTDTAHVHALAWEKMFNEFLEKDADRQNKPFLPFDRRDDYLNYVDGKPRFDGVKSFLESRGVHPPYGSSDDDPDAETICGLGNKKNKLFQEILHREGPKVFQSSVEFIRRLKDRGVRVAVASSSRNCRLILELADLDDFFDVNVDGNVSLELKLKGKPEPDIFVTAARQLGLYPGECAVVEDAIAGVQAGQNGNFGLVVGVARSTPGELLKRFGADIVVSDLAEITVEEVEDWFFRAIPADGWKLIYDGFDPGDEKLRETLTTIGNGYLGNRGALETEKASFHYYPGTYVAGVYNRLPTTVHGREIWNNDLVNCPNWALVEFKIGGAEFKSPMEMQTLSYRHELDLRHATLSRTIVCKDAVGRITRVQTRRIVSMADPHLCALQFDITPINYEERVTVRSSIDGNVVNDGVPRYRELNSLHLQWVDGGQAEEGAFLHVRTNRSNYHIVMSARTRIFENGRALACASRVNVDRSRISETFVFAAKQNATYSVEKIVSVATSLDKGENDPKASCLARLAKARDFARLFKAHARAWDKLWDTADLAIDGDRFVQRTIRLHIYHLLVTASPHNVDIDAGMPARGLHGEAYRGHIFWDELYILPFFFFNFPDVAKALLLYRYRRLDAARTYARENGHEGAMFPWQTADTGEEETQTLHYNPENNSWGPDLSRRQRHVSIAVFFNIWKYYELTGDEAFLRDRGAEVLLEIARFWASIAEFDENSGHYHIAGVMGPDEFHEKLPGAEEPGLTDNAYTNILVVWLLERSLELLELLPAPNLARIKKKIGFQDQETDKWRDMLKRLNVIVTPDGIISQFKGYMDLPELDWEGYRKRYYSIARMDRILKANNDSPDRYKVAKQADALMTYFTLPPEEVTRILEQLGHDVNDPIKFLRRNYEFYERRTSHGSTLSKVVHAIIASYISTPDVVWNWFMDAMRSDIMDTQGGTTVEGVHTGVMAGTYGVVTRFFAGLDYCRGLVEVNPQLPAHWKSLAFRIRYRECWYDFVFTHEAVSVTVQGKDQDALPVRVRQQDIRVPPGETRVVPLNAEAES